MYIINLRGVTMDKMDLHRMYLDEDRMLLLIGSEKSISEFKEYIQIKKTNDDYDLGSVVDFIIQKEIYCNVSCKYEGIKFFSDEDSDRLLGCGLLIDSEFAFEAMILKNRDKLNDSMSFIEDTIDKNKEEIDKILRESEWLYRFEVQGGLGLYRLYGQMIRQLYS